MQNGTPKIQALGRANAILEAVAASPAGELTLVEISHVVRLKKTTCFNLARSLTVLGFLAFDPATKKYWLGLRNLELGRKMQNRFPIDAVAKPLLLRLVHEIGETVSFAVPYNFEVFIYDSVEGRFSVRAKGFAGGRYKYHSTASGRSMLAYFPESVRQAIYEAEPFISFTSNTITDVPTLEKQLVEIRKRGYALDLEEMELGEHCVAVPMFDGLGSVVGAVSVSGPVSRMTIQYMRKVARLIRQEADRGPDQPGQSSPTPDRDLAAPLN